MYIRIRKVTTAIGDSDLILNISKMAFIHELRKLIQERMDVAADRQRLYYKGKLLVDDHQIKDYDIQLNDVIQLMFTHPESSASNGINGTAATNGTTSVTTSETDVSSSEDETGKSGEEALAEATEGTANAAELERAEESIESKYFQVGDAVDVIDQEHGAWFEARIVKIIKNDAADGNLNNLEPDVVYRIKMETEQEDKTFDVKFTEIRLRSYYKYKKVDLTEGQRVLVNYNTENPSTRGYWYDCKITKASAKVLKGTVLIGKEKAPIDNCSIKYCEEILRIEKTILLKDRTENFNCDVPPLRKGPYYCEVCLDDASKLCKDCGCHICAGKEECDLILLCDECNYGYHTKCLTPPLAEIPSDPEWFCPSCKNDENEIVKAGDKLKFSTKKSKQASSKQSTSRDWGRGMACVGRTKECTIVPKHHYGPVPGVDVGTCWKFRLQVSESGIHRPHVAGIHGRENDGAYSLVLSGGYAEDVDNGEEFVYSGSGGRDLSGNKRISGQSCDQTLTRMNKALAMNCNVPLNKNGGEASDWRGGKPVRVVRNYKLRKYSDYAPKDGNRYDGLYKIVRYYPEKNKAGLLIWKYVLRRDDPDPAPWAEGGRELDMLYPPGFLEAQASENENKTKTEAKGQKRKSSFYDIKDMFTKKPKSEAFQLDAALENLIESDSGNRKLWEECKSSLSEGKHAFLSKIEETFMCICCQELVYSPVTTECNHNVCKSCLKRSFSAKIYNCPYCRFEFDKNMDVKINKMLSEILLKLFPGYDANR